MVRRDVEERCHRENNPRVLHQKCHCEWEGLPPNEAGPWHDQSLPTVC